MEEKYLSYENKGTFCWVINHSARDTYTYTETTRRWYLGCERSRIITGTRTSTSLQVAKCCLQRIVEDKWSGQNVFRNLHDSVAVLRVPGFRDSKTDAAIRFPRMLEEASAWCGDRSRNTRKRDTSMRTIELALGETREVERKNNFWFEHLRY